MGAKENSRLRDILLSLSPWQKLARINSGQGWVGEILKRSGKYIKLAYPAVFHGAPAGTPDLCGWESIKITPEMVGKRVAVFVGHEVKATPKDKLNPKQRGFRKLLVEQGGIHREDRVDGVKETTNLLS